jgi:hypothetical protein
VKEESEEWSLCSSCDGQRIRLQKGFFCLDCRAHVSLRYHTLRSI